MLFFDQSPQRDGHDEQIYYSHIEIREKNIKFLSKNRICAIASITRSECMKETAVLCEREARVTFHGLPRVDLKL